ncbi:MAG: hypothetical protein H0S84_05140 [Bacteroidales bacterium]|nr:hypothetical protein [Bacteroidales bacterium]MDN5348612.1 hypothetical protein [Bacteroidales bacterium]
MKLWSKALLVLALLALVASCSPQRKLAKTYVAQSNNWGILVLFPEQIFKINDRYDRNESGLSRLPEIAQQDSLINQTLFLKQLNDSLVLSKFKKEYWEALSKYDVVLYSEDDFNRFYDRDSLSWIANIAQLELQEFISDFEDEDVFFGMRYTHTVPLNGVNLAVWLELNSLNEDVKENRVYFTDQNIYDYHEGQFYYDFATGNVNYYYDVDTLKVNDLMDFVGFMGRLSAAYTYDQILNNRLQSTEKSETDQVIHFRYDPYAKRLFQTEYDRFIELDN